MTVLFQKEEERQDIWQLDFGSALRYTKEAGKTSKRVAICILIYFTKQANGQGTHGLGCGRFPVDIAPKFGFLQYFDTSNSSDELISSVADRQVFRH
jgi:hypothetical protein